MKYPFLIVFVSILLASVVIVLITRALLFELGVIVHRFVMHARPWVD